MTLSVNDDGVLSGSDVNGCVLNGSVEIVHSDRNYYSATIDVDNCVAGGSYEGIAFLDDPKDGTPGSVLRVVAANEEHALALRLTK
jgi:hypothetical protein